jgi:formylglycine-generating enzyme required for sulfatase activity
MDRLVNAARDLYRDHPHSGVHSAAELLLRRWGRADALAQADELLRRRPRRPDGQRWELGPNGHTLVILPGPLEFQMGSPETEDGRFPYENQHVRLIDRSLAVATKEVTIEQFRAFDQEYPQEHRYARQSGCPANQVTWFAAAAYCNWLSKEDGIDPGQWYYPTKIESGMVVSENGSERCGYRLPTEAEWEYLCRAGTETARSFGSSEELFPRYGWTWLNSGDRTRPVGALLPNESGLFDMLGNVWEWCHDGPLSAEPDNYPPYPNGTKDQPAMDPLIATTIQDGTRRFLRGGAFDYAPAQARAAHRYVVTVKLVEGTIGFRVVRTLPPPGK